VCGVWQPHQHLTAIAPGNMRGCRRASRNADMDLNQSGRDRRGKVHVGVIILNVSLLTRAQERDHWMRVCQSCCSHVK
jgi:hypothetical protein